MKKILLVLMLMIPVLSGCIIIPVDTLPNVNVDIVGEPGFTTNYLLKNNSTGQTTRIICDDFTNNTVIEFTFTGSLTNWEAYMTKDDLNNSGETNLKKYTFSSSGVNYDAATRKVSFTYTVTPRVSPLSSSTLMPSIVVNPIDEVPEVLGETRVHFNVPGYEGFFIDVDVIGNCGELSSGNLVAIKSPQTFLMQK